MSSKLQLDVVTTVHGCAICGTRTKAKGRHGVVCRLNCVIHVLSALRTRCLSSRALYKSMYLYTLTITTLPYVISVQMSQKPWLSEINDASQRKLKAVLFPSAYETWLLHFTVFLLSISWQEHPTRHDSARSWLLRLLELRLTNFPTYLLTFVTVTIDSKWLNWLLYSINFLFFIFFCSHAAILAVVFCFTSVNLQTG